MAMREQRRKLVTKRDLGKPVFGFQQIHAHMEFHGFGELFLLVFPLNVSAKQVAIDSTI